MVDSVKLSDLEQTLKPFYQRASEAEDRLSRLEAALISEKDTGNKEHFKVINDLQSKLKDANAEIISEKEKAQKLAAENEKLQYRIVHLLRSLKDADMKLESYSMGAVGELEIAGILSLWAEINCCSFI